MADSGVLPLKGGYYLWKFVPSLPAAAIFAILFAAVTAAHCYRMWKSKLWRLCIWLVIGGLSSSSSNYLTPCSVKSNLTPSNISFSPKIVEVIGYIARSLCHSRTNQLMPYIIQNTFLLLPPVLFAATVYMILGRIIRSVKGEQYSLVRVAWLTKIFVICDVFSFFVQGGGAGLMAQGGENSSLGEKLIVGGLMIQVVAFGFFCVTAGVFHYRYETRSVGAVAYTQYDGSGKRGGGLWRGGLYALYGNSVLIMVRSVFRVVEFSMGQDGYPLTHEWTIYVFDSALMLAVLVFLFLWHPSQLQDEHERERINSGETHEELNIGMVPFKNTRQQRE